MGHTVPLESDRQLLSVQFSQGLGVGAGVGLWVLVPVL